MKLMQVLSRHRMLSLAALGLIAAAITVATVLHHQPNHFAAIGLTTVTKPAPTATRTPSPTPITKPSPTPRSAAGAPTGAKPPPSASGQEFGFSPGGGLPYLGNSDLTVRLDRMVALGATWLRVDIDWSVIQASSSSSYDWTNYDRVVTAARKRNLKVLGIITYTPTWARRSACSGSSQCPPSDNSDYARFANTVAARYAPSGVHTWEIWNEPNYHAFWKPSPNADDYAALLAAGYSAIKQANPQATVLTGGMAAMTVSAGGDISGPDFLARLYALGQKSHFDAVSYHPYSFPALPSTYGPQNAWSQMAQTSYSLRSLMIAAGDADKKIWGTEFGAPTHGPGNQATSAQYSVSFATDHVTEDLQAQITTSAIGLWKTYPWAGPLFWMSDTDDGSDSSDRENFFGLVRADGSHKPAYDAFIRAIAH